MAESENEVLAKLNRLEKAMAVSFATETWQENLANDQNQVVANAARDFVAALGRLNSAVQA
jgi:hypothetical protein